MTKSNSLIVLLGILLAYPQLPQVLAQTNIDLQSQPAAAKEITVTTADAPSNNIADSLQSVGKGLESAVNDVGKGLSSFLRALNPMEATARQLESLLQEMQFLQAKAFLSENNKYFSERYAKSPELKEKELKPLAQFLEDEIFKPQMQKATENLVTVDSRKISQQELWAEIESFYVSANQLNQLYEAEAVFAFLGSQPIWRNQLLQELSRVKTLLETDKKIVIKSRYAEIFETGEVPKSYPVIGMNQPDLFENGEFQSKALSRILYEGSPEGLHSLATTKSGLLSDETKKSIDKAYLEQIQSKLLADKLISLDELVSPLVKNSSPFKTQVLDFSSFVKIGFIDLTAEGFKDKNVLDFKVKFQNDLPFKMEDARTSMLSSNALDSFDYLFVVDMSAAKIKRSFKNNEQVVSTMAAGDTVSQSQFVSANSNFSMAMSRVQSLQLEHARTRCVSSGECLALSVIQGIAMGGAQAEMQAAQQRLSNTPQMKTEIVYQSYNYQRVAIDASKTARVDYYLIDTKAKKFHSSFFEYNDREGFNVAYGVVDADPNKSSIEGAIQKEVDVTKWEVAEPTVLLSILFDLKNLDQKNAQKFAGIEAFLQRFQNKKYDAAGVQFARSSTPLPRNARAKSSTATADTPIVKTVAVTPTESIGLSASSSGVIADERFDSIVLIKGPNSIGTGFYITPDLILTAYHVVDKSNLAELTYYDGTKSFGKVVDHDVRLDLALIRAQTTGKPLKIHSGPIKLGSTVEAIGHPKGFEFTITRGIISALRKQQSVTLASKNLVEFLQTDTPISPGNSGGPLLLGDSGSGGG